MADARLLHKKGIHGERIIALDHLEFRVWVQYVLSADDYGVMRASATVLRADNQRLEREPFKRVVAAMMTLERVGLVQIFEHQGTKFWWQTDWQDFQNVRYPRDTVNPPPSPEKIATATAKTQQLFGLRSVGSQKHSENISEIVRTPARAGVRETQTLTPTQTPEGSGVEREKAPTRELWALFDQLHRARFDDAPAELDRVRDTAILAAIWRKRGNEETERLMRAFFDSRDRWVVQAGFTVPVFKSQISRLVSQRPKIDARAERWSDECARLHDSRCGNQNFHIAKMAEQKEATA